MGQASKKQVKLTPAQQCVFQLIALQEALTGSARMTKREMAEELGYSRKTIDRAVARLKEEHLIEVKPVHLENGGQIANTYCLARRFDKE